MRAISVLLALLLAQTSLAQKNCGTIAPPPGELENWIQQKLVERSQLATIGKSQSIELTIPVVVHVLHKGETIGTGTNISTTRIVQQIDTLTADFRRMNADTVNTPSMFKPLAADVEINFVLARQDPHGRPTNGIVRVAANDSFVPSRISDLVEMRSLSHWPADNYLNVYCGDLGTGLIGFATFPEADGPTGTNSDISRLYLDGVFMDFAYFGNNPDAPAFESRGRTLTHELGHFFGLRHIWGGGDCSVDDFISDTPIADSNNSGYGSPCTFPNPTDTEVCVEGEPEMFQNYMDYTDDVCMNLFTEGQKQVMRVVAENSPRRATLFASQGLAQLPVFENDLGISKVISPDFAECDNQITPIVEVTNYGSNEILSYRLALTVNGAIAFNSTNNVELAPFESDVLSFPNQIIASGAEIGFRITEVNESTDANASNNSVTRTVDYASSINLPFVQTFENGNEMLGDFGASYAWNTVTAPEVSPSNRALVFRSFNNNQSFGEELKITTPSLDLNAVNNATLSFKYAYSGYPEDVYDLLIVRISTDCGASYPDVLFSERDMNEFRTAIPTTNEFVPANELEWQEVTLNLSDYQDIDGVRIQFEGLNGSNNLYLDDIRVEQINILANDISLESIQGPLITCNENVDLELEVKNAGSDLITSFSVEGTINGASYSETFTDLTIEFQEYQVIPISIQTLNQQENLISLNVATVNGRLDESVISNTVEASINIDSNQDDFPLTVDFETENTWINTSPQNSSLWDTTLLSDNTVLHAASFEEQTLGIQSWFVSPALSTGGLDSAGLYFKLSYASRPGFNDQFRVLLSGNCGKLFDQVILEANSDSLAVAESSERWIPASETDWKEFSIDISQTLDIGDSLRIAFVMVNGNGNDLYIDDISIRGNEPANFRDIFRVYPNPATSVFQLGFNFPQKEAVVVEMVDMSGKIVLTQSIGNAFNQIVSFEAPKNPGLYFIRIKGSNFVETQRLFVNPN